MEIAAAIAAEYGALPEVEAVALAGSRTGGLGGPESDVDIYVYVSRALDLAARSRIAARRGERSEIGNQFWEPGDEWIESGTGHHVDVMFRTVSWIEDQLDRVLVRHEASVGYSTCIWHCVRTSVALFDRKRWFAGLQRVADQPYPEPLRRAVLRKNHPVLRNHLSSYQHQLESALRRGDSFSVHHRVTALLASYFDILFAVNRMAHPGEKRLLQIAEARCALKPESMEQQVRALLRSLPEPPDAIIGHVQALLDGLDRLLAAEGLL